jgi:hypothetical protein
MSKFSSHKVRVYMGKFNVGADVTQVSVGLEVAALDQTTITSAGEDFLGGMRSDTITMAALYDGAGGTGTGAADALSTHVGGTASVQVYIGTTTGNVAYVSPNALITQYGVQGAVAELVRTEVQIQPDGTIQRGRVLAVDLTGVTATGGNTDTFAASTGGGTAYFSVHSMVGTGKLFLQHSTGGDGTGYTSIGTFVLASGTAQSTAIVTTGSAGGTMFRFSRIQGSGTGTPSFSVMEVRP